MGKIKEIKTGMKLLCKATAINKCFISGKIYTSPSDGVLTNEQGDQHVIFMDHIDRFFVIDPIYIEEMRDALGIRNSGLDELDLRVRFMQAAITGILADPVVNNVLNPNRSESEIDPFRVAELASNIADCSLKKLKNG